MVFKRLITTLIFILAATSVCLGQQSAQATMKVQVTILEGNSISNTQKTNIELSGSSSLNGPSEITTLTINKRTNSAITINRPNKIELKDSRGQNLSLPIIYTDKITDKKITSRVDMESIVDKTSNRGNYKGSFTTTVAYL
jgi:hypothetical protein